MNNKKLIIGVIGILPTGAASDFSEATKIATAMVVECGMSDKVSQLSFSVSYTLYIHLLIP